MNPFDDRLSKIRGWLDADPLVRRWPVLARAAAVVVMAVGVAVLFSCNASPAPRPAARPSPSATAPVSQSPSPSTSAGPITVPVYYVVDVAGPGGSGPRLYREFHRVPSVGGDPIVTAVAEMFGNTAEDPDYGSPWPAGTRVLSVTVSGDTATVDLSGFVSVGAAFESAMVQQLVYTVTGADPSVKQVRLLVNGATPPSGHSDWSAPVGRATMLDVQAYVWILAPEQGATVGSPVTITVYGTGFEGMVPIKVFRGGIEVASTFVTTMMGGFVEASTTVDLPAGDYQVRAYNDNGRDASLQLWDTKDFTVE